MNAITYEDIARWEPEAGRLADLATYAARSLSKEKGKEWCATQFFQTHVRKWIALTVGQKRIASREEPNRREAFLRTPEAYTIVYQHIAESLPECRECSCN